MKQAIQNIGPALLYANLFGRDTMEEKLDAASTTIIDPWGKIGPKISSARCQAPSATFTTQRCLAPSATNSVVVAFILPFPDP